MINGKSAWDGLIEIRPFLIRESQSWLRWAGNGSLRTAMARWIFNRLTATVRLACWLRFSPAWADTPVAM